MNTDYYAGYGDAMRRVGYIDALKKVEEWFDRHNAPEEWEHMERDLKEYEGDEEEEV
jgi:hypothetical protein